MPLSGAPFLMELSNEFYVFVAVGLLAQLVDGALGMAFGLLSSSILATTGLPPAIVSASVHAAEMVTTGVSGASHLMMHNVDRRLFLRLAIPGVIGGVLGAYVLTSLPGDLVRPVVSLYLLGLGGLILWRAARQRSRQFPSERVPALGFVSGVLDAIGGGGWGPLATSTLLAGGGEVRQTIGSVNAAEFVVTVAISISFFGTIGTEHLDIVLGLMLGGVLASPLAAVLVKRAPERWVLVAVGLLVSGISAWQLARAWLV